jgi:hypothetical protein
MTSRTNTKDTVTIKVSDGLVIGVTNLPKDYSYKIVEYDKYGRRINDK